MYKYYFRQKKDHEIDEVLDYSQDPDSDINEVFYFQYFFLLSVRLI